MERARAASERGGKASLFMFVNQLDPRKEKKIVVKSSSQRKKDFYERSERDTILLFC